MAVKNDLTTPLVNKDLVKGHFKKRTISSQWTYFLFLFKYSIDNNHRLNCKEVVDTKSLNLCRQHNTLNNHATLLSETLNDNIK